MIVTCPGCAANYRVRNEAVPDGGAKMRCPRCGTVFLALAPEGGGAEADEPSGAEPATPLSPFDVPATSTPATSSPAAPAPRTTTQGAHRVATDLGHLVQGSGAPSVAPPAASEHAQALPGGDLFPAVPPTGVSLASTPVARPHVAMVDDGDDPFANLDLSTPAPPSEAPRLTVDESAYDAQGAANLSLDPPTTARLTTAGAAAPVSSATQPPAARATAHRQAEQRTAEGPSLGAFAASWVVLLMGVLAFGGGATFAAWTAGVIDLEGALMPLFEENLDVHPPISSLGRDALKPASIEAAAEGAALRGDLVEAATHQRRRLALGEDAAAKSQLDELLTKLNHPGLL